MNETAHSEIQKTCDRLLGSALQFVRGYKAVSSTLLSARFNIGFLTSLRLMEMLEEHGAVGPRYGVGLRDVIRTADDEPVDHAFIDDALDEACARPTVPFLREFEEGEPE